MSSNRDDPGDQARAFLEVMLVGNSVSGTFGTLHDCVQTEVGVIRTARATMSDVTIRSTLTGRVEMGHLFFHLVVVESRLVLVRQYDQTTTLSQGEIFLYPNWGAHDVEILGTATFVLATLPLWWMGREVFKDIPVGQVTFLIPSHFPTRGPICVALDQFLTSRYPSDLENECLSMFADLMSRSAKWVASNHREGPHKSSKIGRILTVISENSGEERFTPAAAAELLKCSVRSLHAALAESGTTFNKMLLDCRLRWAAHLLSTTGDRVSAIAYAVGFTSFPHFCRAFKRHFGISALAFRERGLAPVPTS